jgi:hypothetical protein
MKPRRLKPRQTFREETRPNAIIGQNIVIKDGEEVQDLVLIGGSAEIHGDVIQDVVVIGGSIKLSGRVGGELVAIGSSFDCSGTVHRNVHVIMGKAHLTETAVLERGAMFLGGPFKISPQAAIMGERTLIPIGDVFSKVEGLKEWLVKGLLWGRLLPLGVKWAWIVAFTFTGVYLVSLILFPEAIKAVFLALEERPVTSIFSGFLTLILFAPLSALLLVSVIGIPVVPFVQVGLVLAILFGKAGVMCFLGRSFGRSAGASILQAPLAAFVLGATMLVLAYMIPVAGLLAWILATVFGLGGAVVALAGLFKREEASVPPAPVMVRAAPPLAAGASSGIAAPPLTEEKAVDTLLLPRAGFWKRFLASLLDLLLLGFLAPFLDKAFLPFAVFYFVVLWGWKGTTIGGILLRLRVVRTNGLPVTFPVALVRSLSSFFSAAILFLGFLWCAWDREKQSWHDKIAGTVVVQVPKGVELV